MKRRAVISDMLGIAIEPTYFDLEHYTVDPADVVKRVREIGANAIRLGVFSHQGHAYYPSQVAPEAPFLNGRNLLTEFEQQCKKQGVRLVVYVNSKWVTDVHEEHPDWAVRFKDGPFMHPDERASLVIHPMCPNSPFIDYCKSIVGEIVTASRPDAVYIDNFGIEPFCVCRFCRKQFAGKIPDRAKWNSPETRAYLRWCLNRSLKIARDIVSAGRVANPQMPVIFNRGIFWTETGRYSPEDNYRYAHEVADAVHTESAVRLYGDAFEHINEQCAFGRSIDLPIWTWVEYPMLPFSYVPCSPEETKIKAAKVIANGGRPMVWSMPCAPLVNQKGMAGIREVFELVRRHEDVFNNVRFDKFAGIVFSSRSIIEYCQGDRAKLGQYRKTFSGAHQIVIRNHLPYDFILDQHIAFDHLRRYKAIILPNVICLSKSQCDAIRTYVNNGGSILATYQTSLCTPGRGKRKDFALKDVFGAGYLKDLGEQVVGMSAAYARFTVDHPVSRGGFKDSLFPIGGKYVAVESDNGIATLLKRCRYYCDHPQPPTEYPAVIARTYGKGKVVYIPGEFFACYYERGLLEYSQLFRQIIEWFADGRLPVATDLPDTVEITIAANKKGQKIIHLVNCSFDKTRAIKNIIPVRGKYVKLLTRWRRARAKDLAAGKKLNVRIERDGLRIALPELTGYNVVVVDRI